MRGKASLIEGTRPAESRGRRALDAGERAKQRERRAARLPERDRELVLAMARRIREIFPMPSGRGPGIAEHTAVRGSGRVGRTAAGRGLESRPLMLAVVAAVRPPGTPDTDALLASGLDRRSRSRTGRDRVEETSRGMERAKWLGGFQTRSLVYAVQWTLFRLTTGLSGFTR